MSILRAIKKFLDPRLPIGRAGFAATQVVGVIIGNGIHHWKWIANGASEPTLIAVTVALYLLLVTITAKRLLAVGWSRMWTLAIAGPVALDFLLIGTSIASTVFFKVTMYALYGLYVGYCLFVLVLVTKDGDADSS